MKSLADLPTLPGVPLLGHLPAFRRDPYGLAAIGAARGDELLHLRLGPVHVVVVLAAGPAEEVLVHHADAFVKSRGLGVVARPLLGDGLLTAEHEHHKRQRKLMAPSFAHKRIAGYADTMAALTEREQARLSDGAVVDAAAEMMRLTLAIVGKTLFDAELSGDTGAVGKAMEVALRHIVTKAPRPLSPPYFVPTPDNLRFRKSIATLDAIVFRMIADRRKSGVDTGDVLSMLLAARDEEGGSMDDRQVRDEVMTLFLAGHETTANALAWTFHLLADAPEVRAKLEAEVDGVLGGRVPTHGDLQQLPYTLAVLKESMRLYPPAHIIGRRAERDVELSGHRIPKGTMVMISVRNIHRRPSYWPQPDRFDPGRFLDGQGADRPRLAWMPFGAGVRVCIGNHFALMEGQIVLAHLVQRLRFARAGTLPVVAEPLVTLRPRNLVMRVERRGRADLSS